MVKYLLKTLCTDMTKMAVTYIATDHSLKVPEDTPTLNKVIHSRLTLIVCLRMLCVSTGQGEDH